MKVIRKLALATCSLLFVLPLAGQIAGAPVLLKNVNVVDPSGNVQEGVSIEIAAGKIVAIGKNLEEKKGYRIVDKKGKFVIPGLIDLRVQLGASPGNRIARAEVGEEQRIAWLHSFLKMGVTTARLIQSDLGEQTDLQRWRERALLNGPAIVASGPTFTGPDGIPTMEYGPAAIPTRIREVFEVKDEDEAMDKARAVAHNGGTVFEIAFTSGPKFASYPRLSEENLAVLTNEAHGHELKTFCWVGFNDEAQKAIKNGCDVLEGMTEDTFDDKTLKTMADNHIAFMPSLISQGYLLTHYLQARQLQDFIATPLVQSVLSPLMKQSFQAEDGQLARIRKSFPDASGKVAGDQAAADELQEELKQRETRGEENIRKAKSSGLQIVTGTSAGGILNLPGVSEHQELELLVKGGLTPFEALKSATANAAACLGKGEQIGEVAAGKNADLVILDANPLEDIRNAQKIDSVVRFGWLIGTSDMDRY